MKPGMWRKLCMVFSVLPIVLVSTALIFRLPKGREYPITVSVLAAEIDITCTSPDADFGDVLAGSDVLSNQPQGQPRCTIRNDGFVSVDLGVSATTAGGMTLGTGLEDTGADRLVIAAIFTDWNRDLEKADFNEGDVLTSANADATTTILARDNSRPDPDDPDSVKGFNVPPSEERNLRFLLQTPTQDTIGGTQTITIAVTAKIH